MHLPRFYPILDLDAATRRGLAATAVTEQLLAAGVRILQFRHKGFFSSDVFEELERVADLCRAGGAQLVVNDRPDIAAILGAGVHLGQDDLPAADARKIVGAAALVGYSTHNEHQFRAAIAEPADYLAIGPIFSTTSKQNPDPVVGLEELRRLRDRTRRPLVAIGGITLANASSVLAAGADAVAVIGDLFPQDGDVPRRAAAWIELTSLFS